MDSLDSLKAYLVPWIEYVLKSYIDNPMGFVLSVMILVSPMLAVLAYLSWVMKNTLKKEKAKRRSKKPTDPTYKNKLRSSKSN